mmetsp:Transcript_22235/g.46449  ORF Transcript_22235/g.46449 Transcript_22235/m.46449 type:complete len:488 (-) Transcript_22235:20-1483(-)
MFVLFALLLLLLTPMSGSSFSFPAPPLISTLPTRPSPTSPTMISPSDSLRLPDGYTEKDAMITLFRDKAGWCPYCQKVWLHLEMKGVPFKMSTVPMRSYGDKPESFTSRVPSGLLPAFDVGGRTFTESSTLMEIVEQLYPASDSGWKDMSAPAGSEGLKRLERRLFGDWCNLIFRPPPSRNVFGMQVPGGADGRLSDFKRTLSEVSSALSRSETPWFGGSPHPTSLDLLYISHVERMLASVMYWTGIDMRSLGEDYEGLRQWLDAFDASEVYLGTKGDYYTHIKDIPPQYGPGFDLAPGLESVQRKLVGAEDGWGWFLGPDGEVRVDGDCPEAVGLGLPGFTMSEWSSLSPSRRGLLARNKAGLSLFAGGDAVVRFSCRAGDGGSKNPRKQFGAELADPYAQPDESLVSSVGGVLASVASCLASDDEGRHRASLEALEEELGRARVDGRQVKACLAYLRDRVGVPRDMPLSAARELRAHLNFAIQCL